MVTKKGEISDAQSNKQTLDNQIIIVQKLDKQSPVIRQLHGLTGMPNNHSTQSNTLPRRVITSGFQQTNVNQLSDEQFRYI